MPDEGAGYCNNENSGSAGPLFGSKRKRSTNHTPSAGGEKKGGVSQVGVVGCSMAC